MAINVPHSNEPITDKVVKPTWYQFFTNLLRLVNGKQAASDILSAISALATNGILVRTGAGTVAARTLTGPAAGITVTNGNGVSGNPTLALANDLAALEGLDSTGLAARTAADTWAQRTITGGDGIGLTNGNGVSGNPTVALDLVTSAAFRIGQNTTDTPGAGNTTTGGGLLTGTPALLISRGNTGPCIFLNRNGNGEIQRMQRSGTDVGSIDVTSTATSYNTSSDRRLKDNIRDAPLSDALARIMAVKVRDYEWKATGEAGRGVIADELAAVCPTAVTGKAGDIEEDWIAVTERDVEKQRRVPTEDGKLRVETYIERQTVHREIRITTQPDAEGRVEKALLDEGADPDAAEWHKVGERIAPQGVDYSKMVPDLIAAVQHLAAENNALKQRIAALEASRIDIRK